MSKFPYLFVAFLCIGSSSLAKADLILSFSGSSGSPLVEWQASGQITVLNATTGTGSVTTGRAPIGGVWTSGFSINLGNLINNSQSATQTVILGSGGISYLHNGIQFGGLERLVLDPSPAENGDDIEPGPVPSITYPALNPNDIISWSGSGSFSLSGAAYDEFFIVPNTGSRVVDGGSYRVEFAAVPEPGVTAILSLLGIAVFSRRRR